MREIKFRAWDLDNLIMHHSNNPDDIVFWTLNENGLCFEELNDSYNLQEGGNVERIIKPNQVIMQFTGLHDKNGKEIYENDIVIDKEATEPEEKGFIVKFFGFKWQLLNVNYPNDSYYSVEFSSLINGRFEIIGDIYSNPELLNK